ncbi:class I adenylate-forming enzyme family protein [Henriciella sp. AS95]|uniref:class I adenylate-forming enzyme family protein n=1 Tax=Henriciella sp. AS95 TaxID=3135782 RepID=UPI0031764BEB
MHPPPDLPPRLSRISDYPAYYAAQTPDAEALSGVGGEYSYARFAERVDAVSAALLARGIKADDVVATLSPPRAEFFILFLATARIGAIWLGLNPRATQRELAHILDDSDPKLVFSIEGMGERDFCADLSELGIGRESLVVIDQAESFDRFLAQGSATGSETLAKAIDAVMPERPALIVYTSGSTGKPKGAMLSQGGMVGSFFTQYRVAGVENVRILNNLPINHIGSVGDVSSHALIAGGLIHFMDRFDPAGSLEAIESRKLTVWGQVPVQLQQSLESEAFGRHDLSSLELIFWSGGVAPVPLVERLQTLAPRLLNAYGMTEATSNVCYTRPDASARELSETVGEAAPDCDIRIVDEAGEVLGADRDGEIQVRSDRLMLGYLNRPEATAATIDQEGFLHTGDVGKWGEDGLLRLTGRKTDMFKSGGYNVYPREIEQVLEAIPGVSVAAVVAAPHPVFGESGVAYVQPDRDGALTQECLRDVCGRQLANYKIPKTFRIREALPLLAIGKVDKVALKNDAEKAFTHSDEVQS